MADDHDGDARGAAVRRTAVRLAARVRELDRRPGAVAALRRVRQALPGDPGFGDPLSAAGHRGAAPVARLAERVFDDEARASRELSLGALQVWQSVLERAGRGRGEQDVTILFTDVTGFSEWALYAGDDDAVRLLREVASAIEPAVVANRGRVVKRLGDGLMAVFPAPQLAFDAVLAARRRLDEVSVGGHHPTIRSGVHTGRPRAIGGDYIGVDVNIAARLVERAGAGEILVSEAALAGLDPDRVTSRRKKSFMLSRTKGVPTDLAVYVASPRG
jgi:adenylate cyclase